MGEAFVEAVAGVDEVVMIHAEAVKDGGVPVGDAHAVLHGGHADVVGGAVDDTALGSAASHPGDHGVFVVIASGLDGVFVAGQLRDGQPAEFTAPHDEGLVEQAALFQIF